MWHLINVFTYVWNGQMPTSWRLRFQSASSFHFAAPAVKYLPWQQPRPTARFQMPPASYQQQLPQPFCLFLFVCVCNFEVWRFLSSKKRHRTNCQKFIKCLALKRVRSLDFGSFHFRGTGFWEVTRWIDPTRVGFAGSNSRISLHFLHMVNWAGHYSISNWWFLDHHQLVGIFFFFANAWKGRNSHLAEMDVCLHTHCTFERALQRHLRCKSVLQCKFPLLVSFSQAAIKQSNSECEKCDLHQGHSMSGFIFELLAFESCLKKIDQSEIIHKTQLSMARRNKKTCPGFEGGFESRVLDVKKFPLFSAEWDGPFNNMMYFGEGNHQRWIGWF